MKLEKQDEQLLFSQTNLPDVFFTEYYSQASGNAIKVYLYLVFLSKYDKDVRLTDLSKKLELPLNIVQDSLKYWESEGIIIRKGSGYELLDIQKLELNKLYKPKVTISPEDMKKTEKNQRRAKAIESINNNCFQGVMSPSWYGDIDMWFSKYGFDEEVMDALFTYCFNKSALHRNYVQAVADAWATNNIKTFSDLDKYYQKQEQLEKYYKTISKKLGIARGLTQYEQAYIEKWTVDFNYQMDVIEIALKRTTSKSNPSFDYIDKILSDWHEKNLKTSQDVLKYLDEMKQRNKDIKEFNKKPSYNNYEQRNDIDYSSLYANNQGQ